MAEPSNTIGVLDSPKTVRLYLKGYDWGIGRSMRQGLGWKKLFKRGHNLNQQRVEVIPFPLLQGPRETIPLRGQISKRFQCSKDRRQKSETMLLRGSLV